MHMSKLAIFWFAYDEIIESIRRNSTISGVRAELIPVIKRSTNVEFTMIKNLLY